VTYDDARRVIDNGLCDGINIKMAKSGIGQSSEIIDYALRHKVKLMIGCMTETMVGLSAAVFLAAGTGVFDYIDLDSVYFLYGANSYAGLRREGPAFVIEPSTNFPNLRTN
jgi:L-alanine-DL-glutamate epimerase-like enolase superfamily enzyme